MNMGKLPALEIRRSPIREPIEMLRKKTLQVYWNDARSHRELLEENFDTNSQLAQQALDIRAIFEAEWRDKVPTLYDFERIQVNFQSITLDFT